MSKRVKLFIPVVVFLALLGLLLFGLGRDPNMVPSALVNRPLPEFSKPDLLDPSRTIDSGMISGGLYLVNVWGTWCPPCHAEHPFLVEISESEKDYLKLVGVNYKDDPELAREFLEERGNPFTYNIMDLDGSLGIDLGVAGAPETFVVDATGTIRYRHVGDLNHRVWKEVFVPILEQLR